MNEGESITYTFRNVSEKNGYMFGPDKEIDARFISFSEDFNVVVAMTDQGRIIRLPYKDVTFLAYRIKE